MARRGARLDGARVALVHHVGGDRCRERGHHVGPPERPCPKRDQIIDHEAAHVTRTEDDARHGARARQHDANHHAQRDGLFVDVLVEDDVDHKLDGLDRHEHGRRGKREGGKVEERAGDEDGESNHPQARRARLVLGLRRRLQPCCLQILADVNQDRAEDAHGHPEDDRGVVLVLGAVRRGGGVWVAQIVDEVRRRHGARRATQRGSADVARCAAPLPMSGERQGNAASAARERERARGGRRSARARRASQIEKMWSASGLRLLALAAALLFLGRRLLLRDSSSALPPATEPAPSPPDGGRLRFSVRRRRQRRSSRKRDLPTEGLDGGTSDPSPPPLALASASPPPTSDPQRLPAAVVARLSADVSKDKAACSIHGSGRSADACHGYPCLLGQCFCGDGRGGEWCDIAASAQPARGKACAGAAAEAYGQGSTESSRASKPHLFAKLDVCAFFEPAYGILRVDYKRWRAAQSWEANLWSDAPADQVRASRHRSRLAPWLPRARRAGARCRADERRASVCAPGRDADCGPE